MPPVEKNNDFFLKNRGFPVYNEFDYIVVNSNYGSLYFISFAKITSKAQDFLPRFLKILEASNARDRRVPSPQDVRLLPLDELFLWCPAQGIPETQGCWLSGERQFHRNKSIQSRAEKILCSHPPSLLSCIVRGSIHRRSWSQSLTRTVWDRAARGTPFTVPPVCKVIRQLYVFKYPELKQCAEIPKPNNFCLVPDPGKTPTHTHMRARTW